MSWIYYLLEANLYLVLFYAVYYLLLRRDTYYQLNRIYLLTSSLVAFAIPLMRLGFLKPAPIEYGQVITQVSSIPLAPVGHFTTGIAAAHPVVTINYYLLVYIGIACLMAVGFMVRIYQLAKLARGGKQLAGDNFKLIEIEDEDHAFSFFSYLFISKKLTSSNTIIQHELVHIRQKHSIDIIYLELLKIICWFNPIVYLLQNSIKEVHEFIADNQIASAQQDVNYYTDFLISNAYGLPETALANNFFTKNLLKNRIMMLHQKRSGSLARLKLLVALPLLCGMLCLSTLGFTKDYSLIDLAPVQTKQVPPPPPPAPPVVVPDKAKMPPPPPPPIMLNNAYIGVGRYMQHNLKYPQTATKNKVKGAVILNFRLDDKGMITDVKVDKSVGSGLDEEAIRLFNSYKKPIKDKAGYHTIGIDFNVKGVNAIELVSAEAKNKPGFVGELYLPGSGLGEGPSKVGQIRFPPPVVKPDVAPPKPKVSQIRF
ncbi:MAG: TonB family protein, partial [Bacteroidota bacterium]